MSEGHRYILAKKIARGGMAEIYLGKHVGEDGFQRLCAIKRILPHYAQDQEFIQMFRDEAHICKRLQHANIVRVEGFEEVEGSYAIIMEYVDGPDLRTLLHALEQNGKRLPISFACHIVAEAARGLHFAHTKEDEITQTPLGIVHRDISPQNILVSFEGEVKVTDFGIADAESKVTETRPGIVKGKYSYMSPEQISAKPVDVRTDVFALCIVLWEMLSMRRLFQGENEVDTIQRVKNCKIDFTLSDLNKDVDGDLEAIVKKGLTKDPRKRFQTAADLEKELRRYMSRHYPDFTPQDLGKFLKKLMESRRSELAADIKKTLTEANQKPPRKLATNDKSKATNLELSVEPNDKNAAPLSLARRSSHSQRPLGPLAPSGGPKPTGLSPAGRIVPLPRDDLRRPPGPIDTVAFKPRRRSPRFSMGWLALVGVLGLVVMTQVVTRHRRAAVAGGLLTLRSQPTRVRLRIDGVDVKNGAYLVASTKKLLTIPVKPGEHTLTVGRTGYIPYTWKFKISEGQKLVKDDIVLKERMPFAAARVRARGYDRPLMFDISDGYFVGNLVPGRVTAVAIDILPGKSYPMRVKGQGVDFSCNISAKSMSWRTPSEIHIDPVRQQCSVTDP